MNEKAWEPISDSNKDKSEGERMSQEKSKAYEGAKTKIGMIFGFYESGKQRVDDIKSAIDDFIGAVENKDEIYLELEACADILTKKEFIEKVFSIIRPLIDLGIERRATLNQEAGGDREFIKINELLSYGIGKNNVHIHIIPEDKVVDILAEFKDGLHKLAQIVNEHQEIKVVDAVSWIVAKHRKIVERFGFVVDGEISEEFRRNHFPGEKSKISAAHMMRDDFLREYLK